MAVVLIFWVVMAQIGKLLGNLFKWLIWKPFVFLCKCFYKMFVWTLLAMWYCVKLIFGLLKICTIKLIDYIKSRRAAVAE